MCIDYFSSSSICALIASIFVIQWWTLNTWFILLGSESLRQEAIVCGDPLWSSTEHVCLTAIDDLSLRATRDWQERTFPSEGCLSLRNDRASGCVLSFIKDVQKTFGSLETVISLNVLEGSLLCSPRLRLYDTRIPFRFINLADASIQSHWKLRKIIFYFNVF